MSPTSLRSVLLLLLLVGAACGDDPAGPDVDGGVGPLLDAPVTLPVIGQGLITSRYSAELWTHGGITYTTTWGNRGGRRGNAIYIWDTRGAQPLLRDSILVEGAGTLGDVEVSPDGRYLVVPIEPAPAGALLIFGLADPVRPTLVTRYASGNTSNGVHTAELEVVDGRLHAFLSVDPLAGSPSQLVILDLADPAAPREVLARPVGRPFVHDVFVRGGYLFTASWDDGVEIWDIGGGGGGSLANPTRISSVLTLGGNAHNAWWFHDPASGERRFLFVGEEQGGFGPSSAGDIHVVDVSDLRAPREVAFFTVPGAGTHNFSVDEARGVLYAAYYNGGVRALNIRGDLGQCTDAQRSDADHGPGTVMLCDLSKMRRAVGVGLAEPGRGAYVWGVQQVGDFLFASDMQNGLWKLDLAPLYRALGR